MKILGNKKQKEALDIIVDQHMMASAAAIWGIKTECYQDFKKALDANSQRLALLVGGIKGAKYVQKQIIAGYEMMQEKLNK